MQNVSLSGCKIEFTNGNVKKSAFNEYSSRLLKQIQKQHYFSRNFNFSYISSPHIFNIDTSKTTSFTMERVNGFGWLEFFEICSLHQVSKIEEALATYLLFLKKDSKTVSVVKEISDKLDSLYAKSEFKPFIKWISELNTKKLYAPKSFCHGDLSFNNILFKKDGLVFIDFLDSFVDSYIIDIIKIRQDTKYRFCLKYLENSSLRHNRIYNRINKKINDNFKYEINSITFQILEALNFLRIEPYINQEKKHIVKNCLIETPLYAKFQKFNYSNLRKIN